MAEHFETPDLRSAHVIVLGNEKGGTGKSTLSIHITIALLKAGYRVASIDLDVRQRTLTRFLENRRSWAQTAPWPVELPLHMRSIAALPIMCAITKRWNSPRSPKQSRRSSIPTNSW